MTSNKVTDKLQTITHEDVKLLLDARHSADPVAGIAIVNLPGLEAADDQGLIYHFHAARVFTSGPETPNFVNPHYHLKGVEPYHILSGNGGEMNLGKVVNDTVEWQTPRTVKVGEVIEVQEAEVHSLRNTGESPLDFTFACPDEHLVDQSAEHPEGDRYLTRHLKNGVPSQYPASST